MATTKIRLRRARGAPVFVIDVAPMGVEIIVPALVTVGFSRCGIVRGRVVAVVIRRRGAVDVPRMMSLGIAMLVVMRFRSRGMGIGIVAATLGHVSRREFPQGIRMIFGVALGVMPIRRLRLRLIGGARRWRRLAGKFSEGIVLTDQARELGKRVVP